MLTVGDKLPQFKLTACVSLETGKEFAEITEKSHAGRWQVLFFWPMDFTFVCPTEIAEFGKKQPAFKELKAELLGFSTDSQFVHLAWRKQHPDLKNLPFAMVADIKREFSGALGILDKEAGVALRATFIVDPDGVIRWVSAYDLNVGRNVDEVVRTLSALQTGALTPCNWAPGQKTL